MSLDNKRILKETNIPSKLPRSNKPQHSSTHMKQQGVSSSSDCSGVETLENTRAGKSTSARQQC